MTVSTAPVVNLRRSGKPGTRFEKIEAYAKGGVVNHDAERNPASAHLFIINPLSVRGMDNLFSTHRRRKTASMR